MPGGAGGIGFENTGGTGGATDNLDSAGGLGGRPTCRYFDFECRAETPLIIEFSRRGTFPDEAYVFELELDGEQASCAVPTPMSGQEAGSCQDDGLEYVAQQVPVLDAGPVHWIRIFSSTKAADVDVQVFNGSNLVESFSSEADYVPECELGEEREVGGVPTCALVAP